MTQFISEKFMDFTSSNITELVYFPENNDLQVTFKSGIYTYHCVPANDWCELKKATSQGKFLNKKIKPKYKFTKNKIS